MLLLFHPVSPKFRIIPSISRLFEYRPSVRNIRKKERDIWNLFLIVILFKVQGIDIKKIQFIGIFKYFLTDFLYNNDRISGIYLLFIGEYICLISSNLELFWNFDTLEFQYTWTFQFHFYHSNFIGYDKNWPRWNFENIPCSNIPLASILSRHNISIKITLLFHFPRQPKPPLKPQF